MSRIYNWKNDYYRYQRYFFDLRQTVVSPKFRSFTWLTITVFTVSFFLIVAIRPTLITIAKLQREIKDKETASLQLQQKIDSLVVAQAEMVENLDLIEGINQMIPDMIDYDITAEIIEEIALSSGVGINSLSFKNIGQPYQIKNKAGKASFLTIPFNLSVSGDYANLKRLLALMQNSRRLPLVNRSVFTTVLADNGNQLNLSLVGSFLYQGKLTD